MESIRHAREGTKSTGYPIQTGVCKLRAPAGRGEELGLLRVHQAADRQVQDPPVRQFRRDQGRRIPTRYKILYIYTCIKIKFSICKKYNAKIKIYSLHIYRNGIFFK